jgi:hypothetical protein
LTENQLEEPRREPEVPLRVRAPDAGATGSEAGTPYAVPRPSVGSNYDPASDREKVRGILALSLVITLIGVVVASLLVVLLVPDNVGALGEVLQLILSPLVGLVGAATGFYYGSRQ